MPIVPLSVLKLKLGQLSREGAGSLSSLTSVQVTWPIDSSVMLVLLSLRLGPEKPTGTTDPMNLPMAQATPSLWPGPPILAEAQSLPSWAPPV